MDLDKEQVLELFKNVLIDNIKSFSLINKFYFCESDFSSRFFSYNDFTSYYIIKNFNNSCIRKDKTKLDISYLHSIPIDGIYFKMYCEIIPNEILELKSSTKHKNFLGFKTNIVETIKVPKVVYYLSLFNNYKYEIDSKEYLLLLDIYEKLKEKKKEETNLELENNLEKVINKYKIKQI